jgi:hypothetical protein
VPVPVPPAEPVERVERDYKPAEHRRIWVDTRLRVRLGC